MSRRLILPLAVLLALIQWPLWMGHGGWLRVWDLRQQLAARVAGNEELKAHNETLAAEIASLRQGSEAIEERARGELHMVRSEETFFQFLPAPARTAGAGQVASNQALQVGLE